MSTNTKFLKDNEGKRVELIHTSDPYTRLMTGSKGTYQMAIVNFGMIQHYIKWDDGSNLMLISGKDSFKFIN